MKLCEIYKSIDGECQNQGRLSVFIRTQGCNLRCKWCDTKKTWPKTGENYFSLPPKKIVERVKDIAGSSCRHVTLTGGEPLLQKDTPTLLQLLSKANFFCCVETNGSIDIRPCLLPNTSLAVDIKGPSSEMQDKMCWENYSFLRPCDCAKFVVGCRADLEYVAHCLDKIPEFVPIYVSPEFGYKAGEPLWYFMEHWSKYPHDIRIQTQLHKALFGAHTEGV